MKMMKKITKNSDRRFLPNMNDSNEIRTIVDDDLFHCRTDTRHLLPNERCRCDCVRFTELKSVDKYEKSRDTVSISNFTNFCTNLPLLWIFCGLWSMSISSKVQWKYLRAQFIYVYGIICQCLISLRTSVINYLFRPFLFVFSSSFFTNKNVNKQNLRWHRTHRSPSSILFLEWLYYLLVLNYFCNLSSWLTLQRLLPSAEACSTRPSPKPRPVRPVWAPEPFSQRENCTDDYAELFCMNGGTCFRSKFADQYAIGCECAPGWSGRRCEIDNRFFPFPSSENLQRVETASIAGGVAILVILLVFISLVLYVYRRRVKMKGRCLSPSAFEEPAHRSVKDILPIRPFSVRRFGQSSVRQSTDDVEIGLDHSKIRSPS